MSLTYLRWSLLVSLAIWGNIDLLFRELYLPFGFAASYTLLLLSIKPKDP